MKSVKLKIDDREVTIPENITILDAARRLDVHIPTLCHLDGFEKFTSCMICIVHDLVSDQLLPACSAPVSEGMEIVTNSQRVREARKDAIDFLLSEHVGDCNAPCQRACPTDMNIPMMIRQIGEKKYQDAIITIKRNIALPAVLGRICPAPCEKGCTRKFIDAPLAICLLKRYVADLDLAQSSPFTPTCRDASGKKVAVIGAGPAGLSAAYYLAQYGHHCDLYDSHAEPGGMLRYGIGEDRLPRSVLNREIDQILTLGIKFHEEQILGKSFLLKEIRHDFDAVVLAVGTIDLELFEAVQIEKTSRGIHVNKKTYATTIPGVFAGGNVIGESRRAVRALAHGRVIAESVHQFINRDEVTGLPRRFNSTMGKIREGEEDELLKEASRLGPIRPVNGQEKGYTAPEVHKESGRCLHCDCRKRISCRLRKYADEYQADQKRFRVDQRKLIEKHVHHDHVIYEPGKCIKCGLCVQITRKAQEELGLTFIGRGFNVRIAPPFNESLKAGLNTAARECVEACPTAALAWRDRNEEMNHDPS